MMSHSPLPPYQVDWLPADEPVADASSFVTSYPVRLTDGCHLRLPLVPLPGDEKAIALLMSNQTSFAVEQQLVARLASLAREASPEAVVGIPTMGLSYARPVAEAIGCIDYVALGHSRKFWYDDALSESTVSGTSPEHAKRVYLDPSLLARIQGRRVIVVDDVLNTGGTMAAALRLMLRAGAEVVAILAVLSEGWDWHAALQAVAPQLPQRVQVLGHIPLFQRTGQGWVAIASTDAAARPVHANGG
jgi:adenine/guanine phosphoribosyltransferase-like PRPP-binding protein